jgi:hypothetical protein
MMLYQRQAFLKHEACSFFLCSLFNPGVNSCCKLRTLAGHVVGMVQLTRDDINAAVPLVRMRKPSRDSSCRVWL